MYQAQILQAIKKPGGAANWELSRIALQYNFEIFRLRKAGYNIKKRRVYNGTKATSTYIYYLGEPEPTEVESKTHKPAGKAMHVDLRSND